MSSNEVEQILVSIADLKADVEWLKKGLFALFAVMGFGVAALITALIGSHVK